MHNRILTRHCAALVAGVMAATLPASASAQIPAGQRAPDLATGSGHVRGLSAASASPAAETARLPARAETTGPTTQAVARGSGGAVSSVDPRATRIGLEVLRAGGTAADAAVATAAALGVTEPYSAGIGGGGYFVHYNAATNRVFTLDGRETAPAGIRRDAFINPKTGKPYLFFPDLVTSGVSVGVPGTLATWKHALRRWGHSSLESALVPATRLARRGFRVDETFRLQTQENAERFRAFPATSRLYLPNGRPRPVGSVQRNPDLARTYRLIGDRGAKVFYSGPLAREIAQTVQNPPARPSTDLPVPPGSMTAHDLDRYRVIARRPTHVKYHNVNVYGMAPSSSGGTTVAETLNILDDFHVNKAHPVKGLHRFLEASARAYADRAEYIGDPAYSNVPTGPVTTQRFANARACTIRVHEAAKKPVPAGRLFERKCDRRTPTGESKPDTEGRSTTHLSVVDQWGNAVAYTLTIEQTGGSGIVVPNRGFLLNNELTDFSPEFIKDDPNRIQPGKRPRSSMSPTIVLRRGDVKFVLGSPGGSTIITTVLQILINKLDFGMTLRQAVAAPRANQSNIPETFAERSFIRRYGDKLSRRYGHKFVPPGAPGTSAAEIGAAAAIEVTREGRLIAVAEPRRRGGGDAGVVHPW